MEWAVEPDRVFHIYEVIGGGLHFIALPPVSRYDSEAVLRQAKSHWQTGKAIRVCWKRIDPVTKRETGLPHTEWASP